MVATAMATSRTIPMDMAIIHGRDTPTSTGTGATSITGGIAVTAGGTTAAGVGMKAVTGVMADADMATMAGVTDVRPSTGMTT